MKNIKQYKNIDEATKEFEKRFLELSHYDKLEMKFDFIKYRWHLFYFYNDDCFIEVHKDTYSIWIDYENIWMNIDNEFTFSIDSYMKKIANKYFGMYYNFVDWSRFGNVENYFRYK